MFAAKAVQKFTARGISIISAVVLAMALFALSGCSTLGIATTKDTAAMQAWQDSLGDVVYTMNARLANLDSVEAELKRMETESNAAMDTLQTRMDRAQAWVAELGLDEIALDARAAAAAANDANRTSVAITDAYLANIIAQSAALTAHAADVEALVDSLNTVAESDSLAAQGDPNFRYMEDTQESSSEGN